MSLSWNFSSDPSILGHDLSISTRDLSIPQPDVSKIVFLDEISVFFRSENVIFEAY